MVFRWKLEDGLEGEVMAIQKSEKVSNNSIEERIIFEYRAAKSKAGDRPVVLTIIVVSGIVQVWEGRPKGTAA